MITKKKHQHQQKQGHNKHCPHFNSIAKPIVVTATNIPWRLQWGDPPKETEAWKPQGYIQYMAYTVKLVLEIQRYKDFCYNWTIAWYNMLVFSLCPILINTTGGKNRNTIQNLVWKAVHQHTVLKINK